MAEVLASGAAPRLERLALIGNEIGDEGCRALAVALGKEGAVPRLEGLYLWENQIGDEGCKALAAALKEGAAPSLKARDAPLATRPSPRPMAHRASPRVQMLGHGLEHGPQAARAEGRVQGARHQTGYFLVELID